MFFKKKKKKNKKVSFADYAFLDSKNLANFDQDAFEGVIERPLEKKVFFYMFLFFFVIVLFFLWKTFYFQIVEGDYYTQKAYSNFKRSVDLFSERGVVFDRNGEELIWNEKNLEDEFNKRFYIGDLGFSHILGFLSYPQKDRTQNFFEKEYRGKGGIEKYLNDELNGVLGKKKIEVNSKGEVISDNILSQPKPGKNITLSIDKDLQKEMAISLDNYIKKYSFVGGAAAMMNIESGEILAMVSLPEYSSEVLTEGKDREKIKSYLNDEANPFLNKVVYGEFVPGSVVKPFIALMGLKNGIVTAEEKIYTNGSIMIPNRYNSSKPSIFRDWKNHGVVDLKKAMAQSSNVYFYILGGGLYNGRKGLGIEVMEKEFLNFGFGKKTGIQFFAEKDGQIPTPEWKKTAFNDARPWSIGNTYYTSIGQFGFSVTPIQVLVAVSSIANNGQVLKPKILKNQKKEVANIIEFSQQNFDDVKRAMRETVLSGTTQTLNFNFIDIASKSGTAQIKRKTRENSWLMGFFPYEKPKYAFVFLAEDGPNDIFSGVSNAAREFFLRIKDIGLGDKYFNQKNKN